MIALILILAAQGVGAVWLSRWYARRVDDGRWEWAGWLPLFGYTSIAVAAALIFGGAMFAGLSAGRFLEGWAKSSFVPWGALMLLRRVWQAVSNSDTPAVAGDVQGDAARIAGLAVPLDPQPLIDKAIGGARVFMGLNGKREPVYLLRNVIDKNHIEILGESGTGKSSIAGVMLSQLAAAGECVVVFDPKADRNLPGALARAGEHHGYPFHALDLRPQADFPQVNPFAGCRRDQVEELLQVALELGKTGDGGVDFYRGKDREATEFLASALADGKTDMLEILQKAGQDERVTEQENLWRELKQVARVKALHTEGGLDLNDVLSRPGVLYVIGSTTRLEVVAAQKLILQRILQALDGRGDQSRPVALFLDELKYLLSPAALRAAGTVRDRNCHLIFAHQSLGDLDDCAGLNPKAVRGAIWGNTGIKIVYRVMDANTAGELSKIAGHEIFQGQSVMENDNGTSTTTRNEKREYMPPHVFTHLPKPANGEASVGVVFGLGPAWFLSTRYIESGPMPEPVRAPHRDAPPPAREMESAPTVDSENTVFGEGEMLDVSQYADEV
ncbi:MAG: TraM recognition domain-containing protein [Candidatus Thermoplasmatota archaeon]|nr:TraM recognition domain-containing protein [Candidatus Thermoplasmatota archaeon]